jgi:hypothetical protein
MAFVRLEVFTAVTMKNGVFWVVTPHGLTTQKTPFSMAFSPKAKYTDRAAGIRRRLVPTFVVEGYRVVSATGPHLR